MIGSKDLNKLIGLQPGGKGLFRDFSNYSELEISIFLLFGHIVLNCSYIQILPKYHENGLPRSTLRDSNFYEGTVYPNRHFRRDQIRAVSVIPICKSF